MSLANKLTILRIILAFVFMGLLFIPNVLSKILALVIFILASLTDFFDGYIARRKQQVSDFGILMDPIADKILVLGAFLSFVQLHLVLAWMVMIILARELVITGLRVFALTKKKVLKAEAAGKHKTVSQMLTILFILGYLIIKQILLDLSMWRDGWTEICQMSIFLLMFTTTILTIISGVSYFWRNRRIIRL